MIRLDSSSRKLQFKTSVAVTTNELSIVVCYSDKTSSQYLGGTQNTVSTGSTVVDICDAPPLINGTLETDVRDIDTITIVNLDTTSKLVYVYYYDDATLFTIISVTLSVGDHLEYVHGNGWRTIDSTGQIKTTSSGGGGGITSINADATAAQTLTVGTTGTDFAIVDDAAGDHKFNLPTASAVNRGALSSGDWTTFNNKVTSVSGTVNRITSSGGTTPIIDIAATYVGQTSITTLGTITTGTLGTGAVIAGVTMTLGGDASYDVYYRGATGVLTRLANGTTGQFLKATTAGAPSWDTPSTVATTIAITDDTTTNATMYPTWVTANTGSLPMYVASTKLSFNPSTGTLTTLLVSATTSVTTPSIIGGSAVGSNIVYKSTTGTGTTTGIAHQFTGGTNGATVISSLYNDGQFLIGTTTRIPGSLGNFRVGLGTGFTDIGEISAGLGGIWFNKATPLSTTYAITSNATNTTLNAPTNACLVAVGGSLKATFGVSLASFTPSAASSGATTVFTFTSPASTAQTASTEANGFVYSLTTSRQWATGALATQREFLINAPTYRFVAASTLTDAATLAISGAPIAGANATITNAYALWVQGGVSLFAGNIRLTQTVTTETVVSDTTMTMVVNGTTYKILMKA